MPSKRVLIITTSHSQMGDTGKKTGLWLEELSTPYYALKDAGLGVMLASIRGGEIPFDPASIPAEAVQQHRERLPQMQLFEYPAGHAFNRAGDPHYHEPSARLARERTLTFHSENLR